MNYLKKTDDKNTMARGVKCSKTVMYRQTGAKLGATITTTYGYFRPIYPPTVLNKTTKANLIIKAMVILKV